MGLVRCCPKHRHALRLPRPPILNNAQIKTPTIGGGFSGMPLVNPLVLGTLWILEVQVCTLGLAPRCVSHRTCSFSSSGTPKHSKPCAIPLEF